MKRRCSRIRRSSGAVVEAMESRRMFAGNVTVVADSLTMTITGDNKSNDIKLLVTDGIVVYAVPGTTVNGQKGDIIFTGVPDLIIKSGNGNDTVDIINPDPRQKISINTGNGNDAVSLHRDGIAWTGAAILNIDTGNGNDSVFVALDNPSENEIGIDMTINTGTGNDNITLGEDIHVKGNLSINGGSGRDTLNDNGLTSVAGTKLVTGVETLI